MHDAKPVAAANLPDWHVEQELCPAFGCCCPTKQGSHECCPANACIVPGGHSVQFVLELLVEVKLPGGQAVQFVPCRCWPAGQNMGEQLGAPDAEV